MKLDYISFPPLQIVLYEVMKPVRKGASLLLAVSLRVLGNIPWVYMYIAQMEFFHNRLQREHSTCKIFGLIGKSFEESNLERVMQLVRVTKFEIERKAHCIGFPVKSDDERFCA